MRITRWFMLVSVCFNVACNDQGGVSPEVSSLSVPRVDFSQGIPGPPQPPVVHLSGTLYVKQGASGAANPGEGEVSVAITDKVKKTGSVLSVQAEADGRWMIDVPIHCVNCSYTVQLGLPPGFVPDQHSLPFHSGRNFSWAEFLDFAHNEVSLYSVAAQNMAYMAFQRVAPPLDPEFDPGSRVYELAVLAGEHHELVEKECIYVYTDVLVRIDYYVDDKPVADYEVDAREVFDEEGFPCRAAFTPPFKVGVAAKHLEAENFGISGWDSMTIVYLKDDPEGQYFFVEGDKLFLDGELVGNGAP